VTVLVIQSFEHFTHVAALQRDELSFRIWTAHPAAWAWWNLQTSFAKRVPENQLPSELL
jgi:hypothetical protein